MWDIHFQEKCLCSGPAIWLWKTLYLCLCKHFFVGILCLNNIANCLVHVGIVSSLYWFLLSSTLLCLQFSYFSVIEISHASIAVLCGSSKPSHNQIIWSIHVVIVNQTRGTLFCLDCESMKEKGNNSF